MRTPVANLPCLAAAAGRRTGVPGAWEGAAGTARPRRGRRAFTLLELLVVIGIIGIIASISVPAIRGLTQSNTLVASHRQVLDELALARQMAISGRRNVYLVFVAPNMRDHFRSIERDPRLDARQKQLQLRQMTNLISGQYTGYALFTDRSVGDQPGRSTPRYLTGWRTLPEGSLFATNKFLPLSARDWQTRRVDDRPFAYGFFPFPTETSSNLALPFIGFNAKGQLLYRAEHDPAYRGETVGLTRGSVLYPREGGDDGRYLLDRAPDVVATPPTNQTLVRVNWLTGRARVEGMEVR